MQRCIQGVGVKMTLEEKEWRGKGGEKGGMGNKKGRKWVISGGNWQNCDIFSSIWGLFLKTCPFLQGEYTIKIGHNYLDIQYMR